MFSKWLNFTLNWTTPCYVISSLIKNKSGTELELILNLPKINTIFQINYKEFQGITPLFCRKTTLYSFDTPEELNNISMPYNRTALYMYVL